MVTLGPQPVLKSMRLSLLWHQGLMAPGAMASPTVIEESSARELLTRNDRSGPLTAPWPPHARQGFWERYLSRALGNVPGRKAWAAQVPLRAAAPLKLVAGESDVRVTAEGFLHPWGATLVLNLALTNAWNGLTAAAERVVELRRERGFSLTDGGGEWLTLDRVAETGLASLRKLANDPTEGRVGEPFSIFSLISAEGVSRSLDPDLKEVARFLQATSQFSPTWQKDVLIPAATAKVGGLTNAPASHLIYGQRRGRTIWSPEHFLAGGGVAQPSTLGCHHRNLVLASMQTEALARYAVEAARRIEHNVERAGNDVTFGKRAGAILGELYEGGEQTYRSGSLKAQIEMNDWLDAINLVRADGGMNLLGWP